MNQQQDKETFDNTGKFPSPNNSLPQTKVVSDIIPEGEKSILVQANDQKEKLEQPVASIKKEERVKDTFNVLTAAPATVTNDTGDAGSVLLGIEEKKPFNRLFIITPVILLVLAGFASAFYGGFLTFPFFGPSHEQVIEKMFDTLPNIKSGRYALEINFKSEPRQAGIQGYDLTSIFAGVTANTSLSGANDRDKMRLNAISDIATALDIYKKQNGKYPQFLNDIKLMSPDLIMDPATKNQYGYRQEKGGTDFTLHVQMETVQGINNFRNAVLVIPSASLQTTEDKLAVIHADTPKIKKINGTPAPVAVTPAYDPSVVLQNLPSEINATLRFSGLARLGVAGSDALFDADGSLKLSGMSFSVGFGIIKKGDVFYGKIKEVPSFGLFNFDSIKNKWVKLEKADLTQLGFKEGDQQLLRENQAKYFSLMKAYLQILKEEKVLSVIKELPKVKDKDGSYYHYSLMINNDKTATIYERFNAEIKKQLGTKEDYFSPELIAYLRGPEAGKINKIGQQNSQMEIWIDAKNFWPYKFTSSSIFVPFDNIEKLKDKQYRAQISINLFDVNKPVVIDAPTDVISVSDAEKLMAGK